MIFDKWREGRPHFIAESHGAAESWKNFSLSKEQGEASEMAGKRGEQQGCKWDQMQRCGTQVTEVEPPELRRGDASRLQPPDLSAATDAAYPDAAFIAS